MKAIIISDLHGNYDALSALPEGFDELWVLGDLVNYGPQPAAVAQFVKREATFVVRGNHDHAVGFGVEPRCTPRYATMAAATQEISETRLSDDQKQFLRGLPLYFEFGRDGLQVYACHAKPSDPLYGYCPADSSEWASEIAGVAADVILVGHTHTPFVRQIGTKRIVNPGSLGQPKTGRPDACYAVWIDGRITLKSFPYDYEGTIRRLEDLSLPPEVTSDLITVLKTGSVS